METGGDRKRFRFVQRHISWQRLAVGVLGTAAFGAALLYTAGSAEARPVDLPGIGQFEIPNEIAATVDFGPLLIPGLGTESQNLVAVPNTSGPEDLSEAATVPEAATQGHSQPALSAFEAAPGVLAMQEFAPAATESTPVTPASFLPATGFAEVAPGFAEVAPGFAEVAPGFAQVAPGFAQAAPEFAEVVQGFAGVVPGFAEAAPGFAEAAPGFAQAAPKSTPATWEFAPAAPGLAWTAPESIPAVLDTAPVMVAPRTPAPLAVTPVAAAPMPEPIAPQAGSRTITVAGLGTFAVPGGTPPLVGIPGVADSPAPMAMPKQRTAGERAVEAARSKLGTSYSMGSNGPDSFDCSGLVQWSYAEAGVDLPRTSYGQLATGTPVGLDELQPGDLVSFYGGGHSALYAGEGRIIHASTYGVGVTESSIGSMPVTGARRY